MDHATDSHSDNCFDLLRVGAAVAVLYSHSYALVGIAEPAPLAGQSYGSLAVALFFAISGFLVCQSWHRDPSAKRFAIRRMLRIMPGLVVVVLLTALVAGPVFSSLPMRAYFADTRAWTYIPYTALMVSIPALPGLFEYSLYPKSNNGSLWTLRYEVLMYAWLATIGSVFPRSRLKLACLVSFAACCAAWLVLNVYELAPLQLPVVWRFGMLLYGDRICNLGAYFFAGCCLYLFRDRISLSVIGAVLLVAVAAMVPNKSVVTVLLWAAIPYAAISFAYRAPAICRRFSGFDYSYGIYIYAFPVQQIVSQLMPDAHSRWLESMLITLLVTTLLAFLSWHYIERPGLGLKRKLLPVPRTGAQPILPQAPGC